jgi:hypothetical protein
VRAADFVTDNVKRGRLHITPERDRSGSKVPPEKRRAKRRAKRKATNR